MELAGLSALELASLLASRHISPVELIEATFARIDNVGPAVNAFAWLRQEAALDDARAAEKRFAAGDARLLEGIPFTAKDLAAIADGPTNEGSRAFEGRRLGVDAGVIARLRVAGAILSERRRRRSSGTDRRRKARSSEQHGTRGTSSARAVARAAAPRSQRRSGSRR